MIAEAYDTLHAGDETYLAPEVSVYPHDLSRRQVVLVALYFQVSLHCLREPTSF